MEAPPAKPAVVKVEKPAKAAPTPKVEKPPKASPKGGGPKVKVEAAPTAEKRLYDDDDIIPESAPRQAYAEDSELSYAGRSNKPKERPNPLALFQALQMGEKGGLESTVTAEVKAELPPEEEDLEEAMNPTGPEAAATTPEDAEELKAMEKELNEAPPETKERLKKGLLNFGLNLTNAVNNTMVRITGGLGGQFKDSSLIGRLLLSSKSLFQERADNTQRMIEGKDDVFSRKGAAKLGGLLGWAAVGVNFAMGPVGVVRRMAIVAVNAMGTSMEIAKEARMKNVELRKKLGADHAERGDDEETKKKEAAEMDAAALEGWAMYEEAKKMAGGETPTREQISNKFAERLPKELLARLAAKPEGVASGWMGSLVTWDIKNALGRVQKQLDKIEDGKGTEDEKRAAREKLIRGGLFAQNWGALLRDADRMITKAGGVDMLSYGARVSERTAKVLKPVLIAGLLAEVTSYFGATGTHELLTPGKDADGSVEPGSSPADEGLRKNPSDFKSWRAVAEPNAGPDVIPDATGGAGGLASSPDASSQEGIMLMVNTAKGDEIVAGDMKLLKMNAEAFGWDGKGNVDAWALKTAKALAVKDGFLADMSDKGGTGLSTESIGHLRRGLRMGEDGVLRHVFVGDDGKEMSVDEFKHSSYAMQVKAPVEAPHTEPEPVVEDRSVPPGPREEILKSVEQKHRGIAAAVLGDKIKGLPEAEQAKFGSELAQLRKTVLDYRAALHGSAEKMALQAALKSDLAKLHNDYGSVLPKGWADNLMSGKGGEVASKMGYLSTYEVPSHHETVLAAVGAREHALAEVIMGDKLKGLSLAEQTELGHQLAVLRRDAINLAKSDTPANHEAFANNLAKLERDFKGKLPTGWDNALVSGKASTAMVEASGGYATESSPSAADAIPAALRDVRAELVPQMKGGEVVGFDRTHAFTFGKEKWPVSYHYDASGKLDRIVALDPYEGNIALQTRSLEAAQQVLLKEGWMKLLPGSGTARIELRQEAQNDAVELLRMTFLQQKGGLPSVEQSALRTAIFQKIADMKSKYGDILKGTPVTFAS